MSKTIVLFNCELDTLNVFSKQLALGFEALGYEIYWFDMSKSMQSLGELYAYMQKHQVIAMIGFNNAFFGLETGSGINVWEQLGVCCINILVDHPYWYRSILQKMPANGIVICIDRNHMSFVERFYPNIAVSGFLAHGGTLIFDGTDCEGYDSDNMLDKQQPIILKSLSERSIDVLYAGSLYADLAASQQSAFSKWDFPAEQICNDTIEYLMKNRQVTIEQALEEQVMQRDISLSDDELCEFISSCVYIERVISSYFREKVLASVVRAGINLTLFGSGWDRCDWIDLPNVHYGRMISPEAVLDKMNDAKIVLNTLPWFKDGTHERVYNGMLRGAVVVSESSGYLEETMPEDAWIHFSLEDESLAALPEQITEVLRDVQNMQKIADNGYRVAIEGNTWQHRAREIHEDILIFLQD